jgi:hypothetical protein
LARQRTVEAIETLTAIMRHGKTEQARVRAAEALLDRAWGRPAQQDDQSEAASLRIIVDYRDDSEQPSAGS